MSAARRVPRHDDGDLSRHEPSWSSQLLGLITRLLLLLGAAYVLYRIGFVFVVVMISVMLALAMAPIADWIRRSRPLQWLPPHARRTTAVSLAFAVLVVGLVLVGILTIGPLATQVRSFATNWGSHRVSLLHQLDQWQNSYSQLPPELRTWLEGPGLADLGERVSSEVQHLIRRTLEGGMVLVEMILIPVLAFSFLAEGRPLKREFVSLLPQARRRDALYLLRRTGGILQSYALGQLILALIAGVLVYVLMRLLGVPYALALGILAAVTRVIPVVGPLIGGVPIVLVSAIGDDGLQRAGVVLLFISVMHLAESKLLMPRLIGHRIDLHPALVIIVLLVGAQFFGMWGMFLAAPFAAVARVMLQYYVVRPRGGGIPGGRSGPAQVSSPPAVGQEGRDLERPAVAGLGHHSGAH